MNIVFQVLSPCAGAGGGDRVGRLDQAGHDRPGLHVVVVRFDRVDDIGALLVLAGEVDADLHVGTLDLVGHRLADVVDEARAARLRLVGAELRGHHAGKLGDLDRMAKYVLAVARTVNRMRPEQLDQLGMHAVHAALHNGTFAVLLDLALDLAAGLVDRLLDAGGMERPVLDEPLERYARGFALDGVVARKGDRLGGVVDDEVDAGEGFEGADVAPPRAR